MEQENLQFFLPAYQGTCPVRDVLSRFGDKWSLLVLMSLHHNRRLRFGELHGTIGDVSPRMLTVTLRALESGGLVHREVYAEVPPRVEYRLTDKGTSLMPHIEGLIGWAMDHVASV